ncbi:MAG: hypothetical protein N2167_06850 [Flavobacteriales bacterium]|nr:hypothetical protein [Flavobacteriales bacterium]
MITIARIIKKFEPEIVSNGLKKQGWLISEMQGNEKEIYINVWGNKIEKYKDIHDGVFLFSLSVKSSVNNEKYYTNISLLEVIELIDKENRVNNYPTKNIESKKNLNNDYLNNLIEKYLK